MPVISAATQARGEGYFRLEWKLAVDRSHLMAPDQPLLLPVVIDDTPDAAARVADEFRAVQWTRLRQGYGGQARDDASVAAFCTRVKALLVDEGIAQNLSLKLGASSAASKAEVNPEAFELYVQARQAWNLRTPE